MQRGKITRATPKLRKKKGPIILLWIKIAFDAKGHLKVMLDVNDWLIIMGKVINCPFLLAFVVLVFENHAQMVNYTLEWPLYNKKL